MEAVCSMQAVSLLPTGSAASQPLIPAASSASLDAWVRHAERATTVPMQAACDHQMCLCPMLLCLMTGPSLPA